MTGSLFLPAHTSDEGTLADIQRWMWMLTAMRRRKWLQLVIGWTVQNSILKLNICAMGDNFTVCGILKNMVSCLSSHKVFFLHCLTVVDEEVANVNRCYS